jgi:type IV pilus assembly protein PilM
LEEGIPRLSRDIHIAGNNFTQKLMEALNLDLRSAESVKLNADSKNPDDAKLIASAEPVVNSLTTEIRTSFDYFESQSTSTVSRIFLSGSASKFLGLKEALSNSLGIAVEHWEPFKKITLPPEIDAAKLKSNSSAFAVAVGLALRGALSQ